jgi:GxxExxY protein
MTNLSGNKRASERIAIVERDLSYNIVGAGMQVYNELGYGFAEPIYSASLQIALTDMGLFVEREVPVEVLFRGRVVGKHRLDMVVERRVILEFKATERLAGVARKQLRSYLAATKLELGLVLHFGPTFTSERVLGPRKVQIARRDSDDSGNSDV